MTGWGKLIEGLWRVLKFSLRTRGKLNLYRPGARPGYLGFWRRAEVGDHDAEAELILHRLRMTAREETIITKERSHTRTVARRSTAAYCTAMNSERPRRVHLPSAPRSKMKFSMRLEVRNMPLGTSLELMIAS